ncbi:UvrD-helicase domain-containing protein [Cupriavidus lacunae]|uniref:DNA 3'-5' helicase n=1 Tax=Cupriavidus lacunae TaxID=2666307 RepID=A0A370NHA6_9BURK|nr:ATP-dependent helicase [Cupriavidus lacunae]RDK04955.1 ATP-dependent helicase [Cupriavidus lacunae]
MFTWTDRELNAEQSEAVVAPGNILLTACPGSGKTRTLTYKIAYELSRLESDRQFVVAITYTNRAADEIRERIQDLGVDTARLWIGTIHAFCLEWIIKPYGIYAPDLANGYSIVDLHARERLLEALCEPYRHERITFYDCEYYYTSEGYRLGCPSPGKHASIRRILESYFGILRERRQIDFELILWHALQLTEQFPAISGLLSKLFVCVLVDEYQDTKQIQYVILGAVLRAGQGATRLFMVGDPNQAIYGSLGGYPIELGDLRVLTELPIETRTLSLNYRSSARIIDFFNHFNVHDTVIVAAGEDRLYPSLVSYDRECQKTGLVHEIGTLIRHNIDTLGVRPEQICVLAPQWLHLASMTRQLVATLPDYQFDGPGMVPFARDIENFWYKVARLALTEPSPALFIRRHRWAGEIISALQDAGVPTQHLSRRMLLRDCNAIALEEQGGLAYLRGFFEQLFDRLGIVISNVASLREHYNAFFASSAARIEKLEAEGLTEVGDLAFFKRIFQNRSGITVSTIHGVKGAEFDVVIAYALLDGMVPHFNDPHGEVSARKLLYVVGSRARKNLHLFSEHGRSRGWRGHYEPTRALSDCVFDYDVI